MQNETRALNTQMENERWLWTPNGELRLWTPNRDNGSERQTEKAALNAKQKTNNVSERQTEAMALNAKLKKRLWMPSWKYDSKLRTEKVALNAKPKKCGPESQTKSNTHERQAEKEWL